MGQGVGLFRNDNPGRDVGNGSDAAGADGKEDGDHADQTDVPAVVLGQARADAGDHARVTGPAEAARGSVRVAAEGVHGGGHACTALGAEAGAGIKVGATTLAEHRLPLSSWFPEISVVKRSSKKYTAEWGGRFRGGGR